tara:strand:+ start:2313 stop:3215 length:903 start_codon:yes stop_codon:yes gene_type:complete
VIKLPSGVEINNLIDDLRIFSWEASDKLLYYAQILKDSSNKSNILKKDSKEEPVTLADLEVNDIIIRRINEKYKGVNWGILSEENVKITPETPVIDYDWLWVLDPLDGTKDFIQGSNNFAMHLALNYKQKPFLGVVLIPAKDELWFGDGRRCWGERRNGSRINIQKNDNQNFEEMTLVTSKNHNNKILKNLIEKIQFNKVVVMGSIGCKVTSIVKGESNIYICLSIPGKSFPKDWDFAAPEAILKSSGGAITNLENQDLIYNKSKYEQSGIIIASRDRSNHENICIRLKEIISEFNIYPI